MVENIIELDLKEFSYHDKVLLKNIKLKVRKGEFILLSGLSGCGKTTLLRILNGLIPDHYEGHLDGQIKIAGKDIKDYKKGELAKVMGNVFQSPKDQFFSTMAEDEVALVGENLGMDRELLIQRVDQAFRRLGIESLKDANIFQMSGGEMQKVAIASSLVYDGDLLLLDEPSASLDYQSTLELATILQKLKDTGKTIIIAEHRLFYLKDLYDRFVLLKDGNIAKEFNQGEILEEDLPKYHLRCFDESTLRSRREGPSGKTKIKVEDGRVKIKKRVLIEDLSFSLKEGECMGVIGENGVGKTTLLKSLVGLQKMEGKTNYGKNKRERLKHSFLLLQDADSHIFFNTVENEILDKNRLEDKEYIEDIKNHLKAADLWDKRLDHPQELSTGEKQRLALIISYFEEKELILLDEPSSGLDFRRMEFASNIILEMTKTRPVILITHDLELLFNTANTVLLVGKNSYEKINTKGNEEKILRFLS
ncbi:MAG: ABC transporter ATP-binding protein [Tissierellia bacterium]|nr:ABC transporter ATP-binding protein [Tissierellia bacterium]